MAAWSLYHYTGPIVAFFFSALYFGIWTYRRQRIYILLLSLSFLCYIVAMLAQIWNLPHDSGLNAVFSTTIYTLCIYLLARAIALRFQDKPADRLVQLLSVGVVLACVYFYYVDRSLLWRIYTQNFGYGFIIVATALRMRARRSMLDVVFFWVLLLFGLHFFVRTILTAPMAGDFARYDALVAAGADASAMRRSVDVSPFWPVLNFSVFIAGLLIALMLFLAVALDVIEDFRRDGSADELTGLLNRRGFQLEAQAIWQEAGLRPQSIVFCDLDHFKSVNDTYGHAVGDRVLKQFADILSGVLRHRDIAARFGGEEFVLLLPRASGEAARALIERVRDGLRAAHFDDLSDGRAVTASFGIAEAGATETLAEAIHRADMMVYAAKRAGRDCAVLDPVVPQS